MRVTQALATLSALSLLLAASACGGGGGGSSIPSASHTVSTASTGNVTMTITYPTTFHRARISAKTQKTNAAAAARSSTSTARAPQYVNPTSGDTLEIYGYTSPNGTYVNLGTVAIGSGTVGADNSQSFSINLTAGSYEQIYADEVDTNEDQLAQGYVNNVSVIAGQTQQLAITMDMNAQYVVLTTDPAAGIDAVAISTSSSSPTAFCPYNVSSLYAYAADSQAGFVLPGTPTGGDGYDANGNLTIPKVGLTSQSPLGFAAQPIGYVFLNANTTISTQFGGTNPLYDSPFAGFANIQAIGSPTCPTGTLSTSPIYTFESTTLTVSNGVGPYSVTTGNSSICTASDINATMFDIQAGAISGECWIYITDANGTIGAPIDLTVYSGG